MNGKEQLRTLLGETGRRMGLSRVAIDELIAHAQVGRWRKNLEVFSADDTSDLVDFLVAGAVKVTCPVGSGTVCVQMIRPGQFFGLNWYAARGQQRLFVATAFTDCVVAMVTSDLMAKIIADATPQAMLQLLSYSWRALSGLLYEKCCLLRLGLKERLLQELRVLARDFGRRLNDGAVVIDLALTHADLAEFAIASRANVARVMKQMERDGLIGREGRRIILTHQFFTATDDAWHSSAQRVA